MPREKKGFPCRFRENPVNHWEEIDNINQHIVGLGEGIKRMVHEKKHDCKGIIAQLLQVSQHCHQIASHILIRHIKECLREEVKKHRTYYKNFHKGFGKEITEGNITEKLRHIRVLVHRWPDDILISVRDLKEILKGAGYRLSEDQIRELSREGFLQGRKFNSRFWYYPKSSLYNWITYLQEVGLKCLVDKGIIEKE